jgi:NUDIX domain
MRREVREETGLDVEPETLTGVYKNMKRGIVALVFRCKVTGGEPGLSDETEAFRWATEADVGELASVGLRNRRTTPVAGPSPDRAGADTLSSIGGQSGVRIIRISSLVSLGAILSLPGQRPISRQPSRE